MVDCNQPKCKTILIVEDDAHIREGLRDALETEGYHVVTAVNGQDGLVQIRTTPKPCLVLLDMMMPIKGGREFLDIVLKDSFLAPIPVMIVSASATKSNTGGAVDFLKKPVDLNSLLKLVAQYTDVTKPKKNQLSQNT